MKTRLLAMMMALMAVGLMIACNSNGKTTVKENVEPVNLTYDEVANTYYTFDEEGNEESVFYLGSDGTASWNMLGSLTISEYNYTISGNKIILTADFFDEGETAVYICDPEKGTLTSEDGTEVYRLFFEEEDE